MMVKDTSVEYDDMVGYEARAELASLDEFLGSEKTTKTKEIRAKPTDPDFPEDWQTLVVSFMEREHYFKFMNVIEEAPVMKSTLIYSTEDKKGLENFFNE